MSLSPKGESYQLYYYVIFSRRTDVHATWARAGGMNHRGILRVQFPPFMYELLFCSITILPNRLRTHGFVNIRVLGNVALSVVTLFVSVQFPSSLITSILMLYAVVRVFEVLVCQTNVLFFDACRQFQSKETYFFRG